jgi:hypothetical protein
MPYSIRKIRGKDLYKVYTEDGKALSKAGLPYVDALKQRIAVSLSEGLYKKTEPEEHAVRKHRKKRLTKREKESLMH